MSAFFIKGFIVVFGLFLGVCGMIPVYTSRNKMIVNFLVTQVMWYFVVYAVLVWGIR